MRSKALTWTLVAKAAANRQKRDLLEEKEKHLAKGCEGIESPKRKAIRVESEETHDYVREAKSAEQEEVKEGTFFMTISAAKRPSASGRWRR